MLVVEQELGQRPRQLGLADAGRAEEDERADAAGSGPCSPARARRTASATAATASSWPTTRSCRRSSILSSFSSRPPACAVTGMPVQRATTSAMSSASTSSLSSARRWRCSSLQPLLAGLAAASAARACVPYRSSAARSKSSARSAASISAASCSSSLLRLADRGARPPSRAPTGAFSASPLLAQIGQFLLQLLEPLLARRRPSPCAAPRARSRAASAPLELVELRRHRVDLHPQPAAASSTRSIALSGRKRSVM